MSESRGGAAVSWLALGVVWVAIAASNFRTTPEQGGYTLGNARFLAAIIATVVAAASFAAFWHARRERI